VEGLKEARIFLPLCSCSHSKFDGSVLKRNIVIVIEHIAELKYSMSQLLAGYTAGAIPDWGAPKNKRMNAYASKLRGTSEFQSRPDRPLTWKSRSFSRFFANATT
jgi:hypothetical protein